RIGPIGFEHGEFGIVFSGNPFVPKVTIDFEHLVEPADKQTLEIEFQRDAEIKIEAERFVMCAERFGRGSASNRLQNWRLDFDKAALLQEAPCFTNNGDAFFKDRAGMLVG